MNLSDFLLFSPALLTKSVSESSLSEEGESDWEENEKHEQNEEDTSTVDLESYTVIPSHPKLMTSQEEVEKKEEENKVTVGQVSDTERFRPFLYHNNRQCRNPEVCTKESKPF